MITFAITIMAIGAAAFLFMHLLRMKHRLELAYQNKQKKYAEPQEGSYAHKTRELTKPKHQARLCPLCRTPLQQNEYLLCAMEPEAQAGAEPRIRQVQIYGCKYCLRSDGVNLNLKALRF